MKWQQIIQRVSNGFIITNCAADEEEQDNTILIESDTPEAVYDRELSQCSMSTDLNAFKNLLLEVCEFFGYSGSKHDKCRLEIKIINQETGKEAE